LSFLPRRYCKSYKSYESDIPLKMFVATKETTTFKAKLIFSYINGTKKEKQYVINNLSGKLLIGKKQLTKEE